MPALPIGSVPVSAYSNNVYRDPTGTLYTSQGYPIREYISPDMWNGYVRGTYDESNLVNYVNSVAPGFMQSRGYVQAPLEDWQMTVSSNNHNYNYE